ncbi:hypothetical protein AgCh_005559 [Apium graveolens]
MPLFLINSACDAYQDLSYIKDRGTQAAQMYTDVGVYYAPGPVLRGEEFDGVEAVRRLCRRKYGAFGTFMSVYYKCKKGRKTEKEVQEAEQAHLEIAYAEGDISVD